MSDIIRSLFDRVYVISLPTSEDRRAHISEHFGELGIRDYEFHDATRYDDNRVSRLFDAGAVAKYPPCFRCGALECGNPDCNNVLIPQQVAVFDTYLRLWEKVSLRNERVLICEDDVIFHPWWQDGLRFLSSEVKGGRISFSPDVPALIRLGWALNEEHAGGQAFSISKDVRMSNPCHAITSAYAQALLSEFKRVEHTVDVFQHRLAKVSKDHAWTVFPPVASELSWSTGAFDSLIHPKGVRTDFLNQRGEKDAASENEKRILSHIKHMYHRNFLIVGHPRCGTGFAAGFLRQMGLDIGHEADGKDGLSSWMFAVDDEAPYAKDPIARRRGALSWNKSIMPLRDIATAVPSIMRDNIFAPLSYDYRRRHILSRFGFDLNDLRNNFQRAVASYLFWNKIVLSTKPDIVFRIEQDCRALYDFVEAEHSGSSREFGEIDLSPVNAEKPYKGVIRGKPRISPDDWAQLPDGMWEEVLSFCERFGYPPPERIAASKPVAKASSCDLSALDKLFCQPSGWSRSAVEQRPVRADGSPVPWFTFGAIEFLQRTVRQSDRVFEYGAGFSTLWWQKHASKVVSVEHDEDWCDELRPQLDCNVTLQNIGPSKTCPTAAKPYVERFFTRMRRTYWPEYPEERVVRRGLDDDNFQLYASTILEHEGPFDIVVIDGMARRLCTEFAVSKVSEDGIIILDNSNRRDYDTSYDILEEAGFQQIPFWGLVPGASFLTCTSVFLKSLSRLAPAAHGPNSFDLPEY